MKAIVRWGFLGILILLSCGKETTRPVVQQQLANNDTPQGAVLRFLGAYERKRSSEFAAMFTGDFVFEFSSSADPDLVNQYPGGWLKVDEDTSAQHLFHGFAPPGGSPEPAASSISIAFSTTVPVDDNSPGVDPVTHKVLATRVDGTVVIPPSGSSTNPVSYLIVDNYNFFHIVRGDAATGLDSSQPADASHWYIWKWKDLTQPPTLAPATMAPMPTSNSTWGGLKANYR